MSPGQSVSRLITVPERMATMRCLACKYEWPDLEAATSQYPTSCPNCGAHRTEPAYDIDGTLMPEGWMW